MHQTPQISQDSVHRFVELGILMHSDNSASLQLFCDLPQHRVSLRVEQSESEDWNDADLRAVLFTLTDECYFADQVCVTW